MILLCCFFYRKSMQHLALWNYSNNRTSCLRLHVQVPRSIARIQLPLQWRNVSVLELIIFLFFMQKHDVVAEAHVLDQTITTLTLRSLHPFAFPKKYAHEGKG